MHYKIEFTQQKTFAKNQMSELHNHPDHPSFYTRIEIKIEGKVCAIRYDNKDTRALFTHLRAYRGGTTIPIRDLCDQNFPRWSRVRASAFALALEGELQIGEQCPRV